MLYRVVTPYVTSYVTSYIRGSYISLIFVVY
jgi:hypothetical protein